MGPSEHVTRDCLAADELCRYHARELSADEESAFRSHIEQCPRCAERAEKLRSEHESWIQQLRAVGAPPVDRGSSMFDDAETLGPEEIEGYTILDEISRGGQGIIYRATQNSTRREVALKVLREGAHASPAARRRFDREIELIVGLRHPNIVAVFDSGMTRRGRKYFVMEFVHGLPLNRYLRAEAPALNDRLRLLSKVCKGVNAAHQRGVVHRDLKPSNILVSENAEPQVVDFGLARLAARDGTFVTVSGQVAGTLPYLSPEQARGQPDAVDIRSDVYALGVILYEMLTSTFPYPIEGDTIEVLRHIAETPPVLPSRSVEQIKNIGATAHASPVRRIDDELQTIILKSLAKEKERRYQTAGELARDIEHYLAGEAIEAKHDSHLYLLRKTLQRHRLAALFGAAFFILLVGSAGALAVMYANQVQLREDAERQAQAARKAEAQASRRFDEVHSLANFCIQKLDPLILRLPGSAPARKALVEEGLKYLDALSRDAGGNAAIQRDLASAYMTIGDVQGDRQTSNLGDFKGALQSYRKSQRIAEDLLADKPEDPGFQRIATAVLIKIADVQGALGDEDAAITSYSEAIARGEKWLARQPDNQFLRNDIVGAHGRLGNVLVQRAEYDEALEHFEKGQLLAVEGGDQSLDEIHVMQFEIVRLMNIAKIAYGQQRPEDALDNYRKALTAARKLQSHYPDDIIGRRDVAIANQWMGIICGDLGRHEEAVGHYESSVAAQEEVLNAAPNEDVTAIDVATTLSKLGESQMKLGRRDAAESSFRRSLDLIEGVVERRPNLAAANRLRGVAYYKMTEFEKDRADEEGLPSAERIEHLSSARRWLQRCLQAFNEMRERGTLSTLDGGVPEALTTELAQLDKRIRQLRQLDKPTVEDAPATPE